MQSSLPKSMDAVIFGAGGHARVVADAIEKQGVYRLTAYLVDREHLAGAPQYDDAPTLDVEQWLANAQPTYFIVAIGDNALRRAKTGLLERHGHVDAVVVHPFSTVGARATLGPGTVVCAGAMIQPNVSIGRGAIVNACSAIGYGSVVEDFVHVAAGAGLGEECRIGENTYLAPRASVSARVSVGKNVFVGPGAVVSADVGDDVTVAGRDQRKRSESTP